MRILLAEDDSVLADGLTRSLRQSGYAIDCVKNGQDADTALSTQEFDLLILDLGLPKMSGLEVLRRLRARASLLPVLILTAADSVEQRVEGLDLGADDYMAKPFALSELAARVEAVMRRTQGGGRRALQVGDLSYDLDTLEVTREGKLLKLNPVGLKLLAVLMQNSPHVLRREILEEALWGDDCPDSDSLRSHVHQLRQVIDKPFAKPLLQTVHGVGYRLAEGRDGV